MADDTERLVLQMSADLRRFEREMARSRQVADRRLAEVEARARQADRNLSRIMDDAGRNMVGALQRSLSAIAPTLAAAFSAQQILEYADSYTSLQNRLKAAGLEGAQLKRVEDALYETANRNGLQVQATAELYQRASLSRQRLGASEEQLLQLVSGTAAALKVQGTSAEAASGPLLQLGQVLGGAKVQAEEYNSLIDGLPLVLQAAAKGSDRFGGDVSKLTAAVKDGTVTSQEFFQALLRGFPQIESQAGAAATTVGAALQTLDNQLGRFIGQSDSSLSASQRLAQGIVLLSDNLDVVANVIGAVAVLAGGRYVVALTAAASANAAAGISALRLSAFQLAMTASMTGTTRAAIISTAAVRGFTAALAANPIGAALVAITALSAGLVYLNNRYSQAAVAQRQLTQTTEAATVAGDNYQKALETAATKSGKAKEEALKLAEALRVVYRDAVNAARALAQARIAETLRADAEAQAANQEAQRKARQPRTGAGGFNVVQQGAALEALAAQRRAEQSRSDADAAIRAYNEQEKRLADLQSGAGLNLPAPPSSVADTDKDKGKKSSGPTPEELARQRELLALQGRIELLRAQGRTAEADTVQRRLDIANLEKQYADAGIENARAAAELQVNAVAQAEAAARGRVTAQERANELLDMAVESQRRQNDELLDQVSLEAELARLSGDPRRIEMAERDLYITQRMNDLLRDRVGLITEADRQEAERQAGGEYDALYTADLTGRVRDEIVDGLRDGLRSLAEGDVAGFFVSVADRFTDRILDNLAEDLADIVMSAFKGQAGGQGGGWMSSIFSALAGKRATGGSVTAGQPYLVGERRPEVFVPNVNGTVIPSVNAAMNRAQAARGGNTVVSMPPITISAPGADAAALARVEREVVALRREMPVVAVKAVSDARQRRVI